MQKTVGYFEGTDSLWLTTLEAQGYSTLPLSNGYDSHGLNVQQLNQVRTVDLLLCYFHKLIPPAGSGSTARDILYRTTTFEIPVLAACPGALHDAAHKREQLPPNVELADPAGMLARALVILAS